MTIDWDAIDADIKSAGKETSDELASKVSSLTRLKDDEVKALFPTQADAAKLKKLMDIVTSSTAETERKNALVAGIEELAVPILKLLKHLV